MSLICYHASHEQFAPSHLLRLVVAAERVGFDAIHSSDHFHPWSVRQGQSGFSFSWIAAAMQATTIPFSMVCAPGQRYHPAIVAQAIATLAEMFPSRFNIELGSGEAINEMITGQGWPDKNLRDERLLESASVIRKLLNGEEVTHQGHIQISEAKLYTLPEEKPLLLCAALSKDTAQWAGNWADGLLTTASLDFKSALEKIQAFNENGGQNKPVYLQFAFSYARKREHAIVGAFDQWRSNILPPEKINGLHRVEEFDEACNHMKIEDVMESIPIFSDMSELLQIIDQLESTDAERIILHNVNRLHEDFIEDYQQSVEIPTQYLYNQQSTSN